MPVHTLLRVVIHPFDIWERGNIFHVCELEDHGQGGYWVRSHRAADGVPNDRTARRGWARWTPDEGHMKERRIFAFYVLRNTHPDEVRHLVGRKIVKLNLESLHAGRGIEMGIIQDRGQPSPILDGRLSKAAALTAPRGVNFGRSEADVIEEARSG